MQKDKSIRLLRILSIPLLFFGVAVGLVFVQAVIQRNAEVKKAPAAQSPALAGLGLSSGPGATVADLSAAAGKGDLDARIEVGRRLARGQGVARNEQAALAYFRSIVDEFEGISAHDKRAPEVAAAFLELARLYKNGAPDANSAQAFSFLHRAASYFGDPAAQVELAKLLLNGDGVKKNPRGAAQWLLSASKKGYAPAQALLGDLLWRGGEGVTRVPGDGLGLLAIARRNVSGEDKVWVEKMFEAARGEAQSMQILEANAFIVQEAAASHFAVTSDMLVAGERAEQAITSSIPPAGRQPGEGQGAAISGTSKALSELGAIPLGSPQSFYDPEFAAESKDATTSAGILQMYQPRPSEMRVDGGAAPIRYAGVGSSR